MLFVSAVSNVIGHMKTENYVGRLSSFGQIITEPVLHCSVGLGRILLSLFLSIIVPF